MDRGFIKAISITPEIIPGDIVYNGKQILNHIDLIKRSHAKIAVFPELVLTGCSLCDLFSVKSTSIKALEVLSKIISYTKNIDTLFFIGLPFTCENKIYNATAVIHSGNILCFYVNNKSSKDIKCKFNKLDTDKYIYFNNKNVLVSNNILIKAKNVNNFSVAINSNNASIKILSFSKINTLDSSARLINTELYKSIENKNAVIYSANSINESTSEGIYGGFNFIIEKGNVLDKSEELSDGICTSEIDLQTLISTDNYDTNIIEFEYSKLNKTKLTRVYSKYPYLPDPERVWEYTDEIIKRQALGLVKRLEHIGSKKVVIGFSGGVDSTLALIVAYSAFKLKKWNTKNIIAITMPGFGTSDKTYENVKNLSKKLNITLKDISIKEIAKKEFELINHNIKKEDLTFENTQARLRTLLLMDYAGKNNTIVVGTSDLSEIALGWSTYNGDHMSMYSVNSGLPKTVMQLIIREYAKKNTTLKKTLDSILDTPISPELTTKAQDTQKIIGPYKLNDFILYHLVVSKFDKDKIKYISNYTFKDEYDKTTIGKTVDNFIKRFVLSAYKRSCSPDGIDILDISLSPRTGFTFPSDIDFSILN